MIGPVLGYGEVLWDVFPDRRVAGGAPMNFAFHVRQLGHEAQIVSRLGDDELGRELRASLPELGLSDAYLQIDSEHPTGCVRVNLVNGQPEYEILQNVAYDFIEWTDSLGRLADRAGAVCFGTLAQRHATSRATLEKLLAQAKRALLIYDVNIRQDFYNKDIVAQGLRSCDWVKLNDGEAAILWSLLGLQASDNATTFLSALRAFSRQEGGRGIQLACLTLGERGCVVQTDDQQVREMGVPTTVVDTVGAGDSFTAGLLVALDEGESLPRAVRLATRLAAEVCRHSGGTPKISIRPLREKTP